MYVFLTIMEPTGALQYSQNPAMGPTLSQCNPAYTLKLNFS